jgi:hypothetical protein
VTATLNTKFSFETFVVGAANRLAVTACRTVAENPGSAYNPLFIYSGSGLGKTHLLMAVGQGALKLSPGLNIEYLTLDEYVEAFHAAVAAGQSDAFRRRFQNVDVLLVDDVQFLTNRKEMQAELLRLTETLQGAGHQIVLTSDRPPAEIADLDGRLISRFSGGLVVDIGAPDYETRVAILRRKAEERGARFEPGVLELVAGAEFQNVRELMGALNRLVAHQAVNDSALSVAGAKQLLGLSLRAGTPPARHAAASASADEFGAFLQDVTVTVGKAVEAWRGRVGREPLRWQGEGIARAGSRRCSSRRTWRWMTSCGICRNVEQLKALEAEIAAHHPQAAQSMFRDRSAWPRPRRRPRCRPVWRRRPVRRRHSLSSFAVGRPTGGGERRAGGAGNRPARNTTRSCSPGRPGWATHLLNAIEARACEGPARSCTFPPGPSSTS